MKNKSISIILLLLASVTSPIFATSKLGPVTTPIKVQQLGKVWINAVGESRNLHQARAIAMAALQQERRAKERTLSPGFTINWQRISKMEIFVISLIGGGYWHVFLVQNGIVEYRG